MPYKSRAQAAYFNIHRSELERQGVDVGEWNAASKGMKLPQHVKRAAEGGPMFMNSNPVQGYFARRALAGMTKAPHIGPISGPTMGRGDKVPMSVHAGSYVLPADHVSGLGQGNTHAGFGVLGKMFPAPGRSVRSTIPKPMMPRAYGGRTGYAVGGAPMPTSTSSGAPVHSNTIANSPGFQAAGTNAGPAGTPPMTIQDQITRMQNDPYTAGMTAKINQLQNWETNPPPTVQQNWQHAFGPNGILPGGQSVATGTNGPTHQSPPAGSVVMRNANGSFGLGMPVAGAAPGTPPVAIPGTSGAGNGTPGSGWAAQGTPTPAQAAIVNNAIPGLNLPASNATTSFAGGVVRADGGSVIKGQPHWFYRGGAIYRAKGGRTHHTGDSVDIMAADGEYVLHPSQIIAKFGDLKKGHEELDKWVMSERKKHIHKLKKLPPPAKK